VPTNAEPDITRDLEPLIASLTEAHERMLELTLEHRRAIARADAPAMARCIEAQTAAARRIAELDAERRALVALLDAPPAPAPLTLTALADRLPEADRPRVLGAARRLRDLLFRLHHETRTLRAATQALVVHMNGLMQQISRALSQTRLYGPHGRIDPGTPVACGLDLTH
jgi:hypothetical protein